jgi:hypothetical protein
MPQVKVEGLGVVKLPEGADLGRVAKAIRFELMRQEAIKRHAGASLQPMPVHVQAGTPNAQYAKPGPYLTTLSLTDETQFQQWVKSANVPFDPSPQADYDMRGFWKALQSGDPRATRAVNPNDKQLHFSDVWKTPFHQEFSNESQYATPNAPHWNDQDQLIDQNGNVVFDERKSLSQ